MPVVRHGLRKFKEFCSQVFGAVKLDAQLAGPQFDPAVQFAHGPLKAATGCAAPFSGQSGATRNRSAAY